MLNLSQRSRAPFSFAPRTLAFIILAAVMAFSGAPAQAQATGGSASAINTGDTAWMLVSAALVMFMTPGLALFYGGMARAKNVLNILMQSFVALAIVTLVWILWGYSLAFGPGGKFIGSFAWFGLNHVGSTPSAYAPTIPHSVFMVYQMMFAVITPALISGAIAERMKFSTYMVFMALWSTLVYCPLAHWVWGSGGWLGADGIGALDFAGGTVVHISSGMSALVLAIMLGKRRSHLSIHEEDTRPHNLPLTLIGTALLWFGWFGFNAGSALASGGLAASAFVATHVAAATAALAWILLEWKFSGRPTALGFATGAVAGLVAITPASGFVTPLAAIAIGVGVSIVCFYAITLKHKFHYDDTIDVFRSRMAGVGTFGAIATGVFATKLINSAGADGLFYGGGIVLLGKQGCAAGAAILYAVVTTFVIAKVLDRIMGLRVSADEEDAGLDITQHGETGYTGLEVEGAA